MNQTRTCPRCGRPNSGAHSFCSSCGGSLSPYGSSRAWKAMFGALALFIGLVWTAAIYTKPTRETSPPQQSHQPLIAASSSAPLPAPSVELTSAQHLSEAKRALADGYKPNSDAKKASFGEVAAAKWHLKAIGTSATEYREAQELLKEVTRRERQIDAAAKQALALARPTPETPATEEESEDDPASAEYSATSPAPARASSSSTRPSREISTAPAAPATTSSKDYYTNVDGERVRRPTFSSSFPDGASAQCRDGSYSFSRNRRGTCSHHGGVARWLP